MDSSDLMIFLGLRINANLCICIYKGDVQIIIKGVLSERSTTKIVT